ncbi:hypothetical protein CROQUDRAFT_346317 [Cronartium quercuum f. sp. fusiforme G11]|uniref:Uncharacterized protein n=1 Tax=Cronartium quercuum f. sp. fusiforme G11 TaxID=708437 RepID=A0A9P6NAD4_9BASI|nr:hypothetical protein CROQUDRAFT_346317 [Cronartium quercuum f. sp. fusiforme G11]
MVSPLSLISCPGDPSSPHCMYCSYHSIHLVVYRYWVNQTRAHYKRQRGNIQTWINVLFLSVNFLTWYVPNEILPSLNRIQKVHKYRGQSKKKNPKSSCQQCIRVILYPTTWTS